MKALQYQRKPARYAAAAVAGRVMPGKGATVGPLSLRNVDEPALPDRGWVRVRPRVAGICGSDLATIDGHSSRYFEPIVSFPFTPGHEVVGDLDDDTRVVLIPILTCAVRGVDPMCTWCQAEQPNRCERIAFGHLEPGLQTGFCESTGGGWSTAFVAHESQLVRVPDDLSDEDAVIIEPTACAVHAARSVLPGDVAVIGAGTLGLLTIAALRHLGVDHTIVATAKHPQQQRLARDLGADRVAATHELPRVIRSLTGAMVIGEQLTAGITTVIDCVGSHESLQQALSIVAPGGDVALVGMPGPTTALDLTGLWHRECSLRGCYAYTRADFERAVALVRDMNLGRLVTATYPLARYRDAIEHAANAGARGAVKIAFDMRQEKERMQERAPASRTAMGVRGRSPREGNGCGSEATAAGRASERQRTARRWGPGAQPPERGTESIVPRPGFVLDVDRSTPPLLFWHGEGFRLERLPVERTRVIYPPEPLDALRDPQEAIRHTLLHPFGDSKPLPELLFPDMKLTIAFDDISLPLPPMRRPDVRQRVIETVLDMAAEAGVDDVHLIAALALHRRMTEAELRHAVGDRVYDAFEPSGRLYNLDAEDTDAMTYLGTTEKGEEVEINRRAAESDLLVYVNINLVAMDGGWKSTATGLASYRSLRHHHNVRTLQQSRSLMDHPRSELHSSNWRMGKVITDAGVKIFQIETTLNTDTFPAPFDFLMKREWEWTARDRALFVASSKSLARTPSGLARQIFQSIKAPHQMTSVQAGEVGPVHEETIRNVHRQQLVEVEGQTDILAMGLPYICPYNVNSIMNPILVMCLGLGYFFNLYRGKPLVREGGVLIMSHPTPWEFHPVHHPSYIDFFEQVLSETTDPLRIEAEFEKGFAEDEWYRHLYRTSYAYHGVHPFYMWYWGAHALQHLGRVIIVGGEPRAVRRLGFMAASTMNDALEMASDVVGRTPTITHLHVPPLLLADVT